MTDTKTDKKTPEPVNSAPVPERVGKTFRGQQFVPVVTAEQDRKVRAEQAPFEKKEGAVVIEVYFSQKDIRDPVKQAAMRAYTNVRRATPADWDGIFKSF